MSTPGIEIEGSYKNTQALGHIDFWYGGGDFAYSSTAAACSAVPAVKRQGLTVGVLVSGTVVEYWWPTMAITDADLVPKGAALPQPLGTTDSPTFAGCTLAGALLLGGDPTTALQAATKSYVDNLITGVVFSGADVMATGNVTLSGEQAIDGITTSASRVFLNSQTDPTQNGLYISNTGAWTRAADAATGAQLEKLAVIVRTGTAHGGTQWLNANGSVTVGTTAINFIQAGGLGTYSVDGTTLSAAGNVFSLNTAYTDARYAHLSGTAFTGTVAMPNLNIAGSGVNGTAWVNLKNNGFTTPPTPAAGTGGVTIYSRGNQFAWVAPNGHYIWLSNSLFTTDHNVFFPDADGTVYLTPTGSATTQYVAGDGSLQTFPTIPTAANYIANGTTQQTGASFNIDGGGTMSTLTLGGGSAAASALVTLSSNRTYTNPSPGSIIEANFLPVGIATVATATNALIGNNHNVQIGATNTQDWTSPIGVVGSTTSVSTIAGAQGTVSNMGGMRLGFNHNASGATILNGFHIKTMAPNNSGTLTNFTYWVAGITTQNSGNYLIDASAVTYPSLFGGSITASSLNAVNTSGGALLSASKSTAQSVELITNTNDRTFAGANNWTGTNWSISGGTFLHTPGSNSPATLTNVNLTSDSIISGRTYLITFTVSGRSTGNCTIALGGGGLVTMGSNGTFTVQRVAGANNADLVITPASTFDGAFTNVSIKRVEHYFSIANNGSVFINSNLNAIQPDGTSALVSVSRSPIGQGTLSATSGSNTITGVGTNWANDLNIGETITAGGESHVISLINSATSITTVDNWTNNLANVAYTIPLWNSLAIAGKGTVNISSQNGSGSALAVTVTANNNTNSGTIWGVNPAISYSNTIAAQNVWVNNFVGTLNITAANTQNITSSNHAVSNLSTNLTIAAGAIGTISNIYGWHSTGFNNNAAGVTLTQASLISFDAFANAGTITNMRGLVLPAFSGGTINNQVSLLLGTNTSPSGNWGIYNAVGYNNYYAGAILIGTNTRTGSDMLDVNGSATFVGGVTAQGSSTIGTDTSSRTELAIRGNNNTSSAGGVVTFYNAGTFVGAVGNQSTVQGTGYDSSMMLYATGSLKMTTGGGMVLTGGALTAPNFVTSGNGGLNLANIAGTPAAPASGVTLLASSNDQLTIQNTSGHLVTFNMSGSTGNPVYNLPLANGTLYLTPAGSASTQYVAGDGSLQTVNWVPSSGGTFSGNLTATGFVKSGGTSSQFLKADGSVDSNTYLSNKLPFNLSQSANSGGTVSITSGSPTVTGTGTTFNADFRTGDTITVNGETHTVITISGNTTITVDANWGQTFTGNFSTALATRAVWMNKGVLALGNIPPVAGLNNAELIVNSSYTNRLNQTTGAQITTTSNVTSPTQLPGGITGAVISSGISAATTQGTAITTTGVSASATLQSGATGQHGTFIGGSFTANASGITQAYDLVAGYFACNPNINVTQATAVYINTPGTAAHVAGLYLGQTAPSPTGSDYTGYWGIYNNSGYNNYLGNAHTLINTTTDDGVNALQVNGSGTFSGNLNITGDFTAGSITSSSSVQANYIQANLQLSFLNSGHLGTLSGTLSNGRNWSFPDKSGTVALLSDITTLPTGGSDGQVLSLRNGGVATWVPGGYPSMVSSAYLTGQTAFGAVCSYTVGGSDANFEIKSMFSITTDLSSAINVQVTYTDETNTGKTVYLLWKAVGAQSTVITAGSTTADQHCPIPITIRAKAGTTIALSTNGTALTSGQFNIAGYIFQLP
ncbi:hypothetical protein BEL04_08295 [Mucilaginibacter sp. PPCGB 2223]|uniref:beta strand repeat-containing protein n=1 Tax=Mucilaginibacter sp. PPCGB 2223 TaxID=1886027 RepID=UPI000825F606|nr:hypothetical protein [Mucilaginibacter sp. PPCGB 2223]OCX54247.1 hypothetical protein BEL04_08295 [Mucilaginibacter sp. PPCGB 2223]